MEEISALAAAETVAILNKTDVTMIAKIPYKLIKGLIDKSEEYGKAITLKDTSSLIEQPISEETRSILLILYREYWCNNEEKENLDKQLIESESEFEKEEIERLNPFKESKNFTSENNISKIENNSSNISTALITIQKKWYVRIFDKIIRFFRKK